MKDNSPHSAEEIASLLSQYVDGELDFAQAATVEACMAENPAYRDQYIRLQQLRAALQNAPDRLDGLQTPLWERIAGQLADDQRAFPSEYDWEFVSAYWDGELADTEEVAAFESQLSANETASRLLAEVSETSDAVKRWGCRLEDACTVSIAAQVMSAFEGEAPAGTAESTPLEEMPVSAERELISAYADQALSARETIEANRLIENDEAARQSLHRFNLLSEHIQRVGRQLEAQAPDAFWERLAPILNQPVEKGGVIVPLTARKKLWDGVKIAAPIAAATLLIVLSISALDLSNSAATQAEELGGASASVTPVSGQNLAAARSAQPAVEIASVPVNALSRQRADFSPVSEGAATDRVDLAPAPLQSSLRERLPASRQVAEPQSFDRPMLEKNGQRLATQPSEGHDTLSAGGKAPSSEEYLFKALNEQMPKEDISNILGK